MLHSTDNCVTSYGSFWCWAHLRKLMVLLMNGEFIVKRRRRSQNSSTCKMATAVRISCHRVYMQHLPSKDYPRHRNMVHFIGQLSSLPLATIAQILHHTTRTHDLGYNVTFLAHCTLGTNNKQRSIWSSQFSGLFEHCIFSRFSWKRCSAKMRFTQSARIASALQHIPGCVVFMKLHPQ